MVLNRNGDAAGFCTGTVLAPTVVMTAAHCAPDGGELRIYDPDQGPTALLPVAAVRRHPDYRTDAVRTRQRSIDLALIRLAAPLPARFAPATLADAVDGSPGSRFTLSGFGVTREGDGRSSGRLRSTTVAAQLPASAVLLWAGDPDHKGRGACTGDSGAPLTRPGTTAVAAIAIWAAGTGAQRCGALTQGLWIAPERAWIDDALRAWAAGR